MNREQSFYNEALLDLLERKMPLAHARLMDLSETTQYDDRGWFLTEASV